MKNFIILSFIATIFFISSCKKSPTACFNFSKTANIKVGDTLTLVNCSTNFTDVKWIFPLQGVSKETSPRIKLGTTGRYDVQLIVGTESFKNSNTVTKSIDVLP